MKSPFVIAIDGPAASGKGTLARRLAQQLGLKYLDTGKLYRAAALKLVSQGKKPEDEKAAIAAAASITEADTTHPDLYTEAVGHIASVIAALPKVREALVNLQRNFATSGKGAVLDGRDIGTIICPDADVKLFITASLETRAKRRYKELQSKGNEVIYEAVWKDLQARDARDSGRSVAPLVAAADAVKIDTSGMDADAVLATALTIVKEKQAKVGV